MLEFMQASNNSAAHVQILSNKTVGLYRIHVSEGERSLTYWREVPAGPSQLHDDYLPLATTENAACFAACGHLIFAFRTPRTY